MTLLEDLLERRMAEVDFEIIECDVFDCHEPVEKHGAMCAKCAAESLELA